MVEIRKINPLSAGKVIGLVSAGIHVLVGMVYIILVALVFFLSLFFADQVSSIDLLITLFGGVLIIVFGGLMGFVCGYVFGYLSAVLYNWITEYTGGLRFELVDSHAVVPVADVRKVKVQKVAKTETPALPKKSPQKKSPRRKTKKSVKRAQTAPEV